MSSEKQNEGESQFPRGGNQFYDGEGNSRPVEETGQIFEAMRNKLQQVSGQPETASPEERTQEVLVNIEGGMQQFTIRQHQLGHALYFAYILFPKEHHMSGAFLAGFAPVTRAMYVNEHYEASNDFENLVMLHEAAHVQQHAMDRATSDPHEYLAFYKPEDKAVMLHDELSAYALELEAMNVLLDGELRNSAQSNKMFDPEKARKMLNATSEQGTPITMLCMFAKEYFKCGDVLNNEFPDDYVALVVRAVTADGYTPYIKDASKKRVQIQ